MNPVSRREFLGSSAKNAAGVAAGMVGLGAVPFRPASDRVRLGVIGVRNRGKQLACGFAAMPDVEVAALCDVDASQLPAATRAVEEAQGRPPRWEHDFRRLLDDRALDALVIATPDHWHAAMMVRACEAGKDVYVEKPVSRTIAEGEKMVAAAERHQRVVQCGIQERSGGQFRSAIEFVRSGRLGDVRLARAWAVQRRKPIGAKKDGLAPECVDYDLWLGPAPQRAFNPNRFHYNWRWYWDYGTGELGNWGTHMLDVARWGLGVEWPRRVSSSGGVYHLRDDRQTPDTQTVHFDFGDRTLVWEHRQWTSHGIEGRSTAAAFYGEHGTLIVDRGGWKVYDCRESITHAADDCEAAHLRNFIDCIRTRGTPHADIRTGHVSSALCHLGNMAHRLDREIAVDPHTGAVDDANAILLEGEPRSPWTV
ncbi:MAG: Gfo/Idh/MocA family oxidoreductase [Planctomycetales bacterium]